MSSTALHVCTTGKPRPAISSLARPACSSPAIDSATSPWRLSCDGEDHVEDVDAGAAQRERDLGDQLGRFGTDARSWSTSARRRRPPDRRRAVRRGQHARARSSVSASASLSASHARTSPRRLARSSARGSARRGWLCNVRPDRAVGARHAGRVTERPDGGMRSDSSPKSPAAWATSRLASTCGVCDARRRASWVPASIPPGKAERVSRRCRRSYRRPRFCLLRSQEPGGAVEQVRAHLTPTLSAPASGCPPMKRSSPASPL